MALATFVFPFLALFLRTRGFSPERTGLVLAIYGAGSIPAGVLAGGLTDRVGRRPTLLGALLAQAALTALLPAVSSVAALTAAVLALGIASSAYWPASGAMVADVLREDQYAEANGLLYWERNAGIGLSFALGGVLATFGYGRLFLADAVTTALFAAVVWLRLPETRPARPEAVAAGPAAARGWGAVLSDRALLILLGLLLAQMIAMFQFMVALPLAMAERGLGPAAYGRAMAMNGLVIVLLQPLATRLTARRDEGRVLALAGLFLAAGYGAYAFCHSGWAFAAATGVWSVGEILTIPTVSAMVSRLAPADLRGRYQGLFSLSFGLALTLAPAIGGAVLGRLGADAVWAGAFAVGVLVALGYLAAAPRWARPAAASPVGAVEGCAGDRPLGAGGDPR
jgi:MFS family permease